MFARKHSVAAVPDHAGISRGTFYAWQRHFREGGVDGLANNYGYQSKRSNTRAPALVARIRSRRQARPNIGAGKPVCLLPEWCQRHITGGCRHPANQRSLASLPMTRIRCGAKRPRQGTPRERKQPGHVPRRTGECVAFGTLARSRRIRFLQKQQKSGNGWDYTKKQEIIDTPYNN